MQEFKKSLNEEVVEQTSILHALMIHNNFSRNHDWYLYYMKKYYNSFELNLIKLLFFFV
jgi:hypothetical protein